MDTYRVPEILQERKEEYKKQCLSILNDWIADGEHCYYQCFPDSSEIELVVLNFFYPNTAGDWCANITRKRDSKNLVCSVRSLYAKGEINV